jgi:hypothetical protein
MTFETRSGLARWAPRVRLALLLLVAVFVGHDAVYLAQYGLGSTLAQVMTDRGHDGYWLALVGLSAIAGALLLAGAATVLLRLHQRLSGLPPTTAARAATTTGLAYLPEVLRLWRVLLPATILLFALQENAEYLFAHGDVLGIEAIVGPNAPLAIPVLAIVTLALAALGGLVRWRIAVLSARIARSIGAGFERVFAAEPAREWTRIHDLAPHRWIRSRLDAGRAPPTVLPA